MKPVLIPDLSGMTSVELSRIVSADGAALHDINCSYDEKRDKAMDEAEELLTERAAEAARYINENHGSFRPMTPKMLLSLITRAQELGMAIK